jgi:hypothetical protein
MRRVRSCFLGAFGWKLVPHAEASSGYPALWNGSAEQGSEFA